MGILTAANLLARLRDEGPAVSVISYDELFDDELFEGALGAPNPHAELARFRRLAKDYERLPELVAGLHFVAFACLMLHRMVTLDAQRP